MSKIALTGKSGGWFDSDTAIKFSEATRWDGHNHISCETGSQWEHEALYYTARQGWVLHAWSQWEGTADTYASISQDDAIAWLSRNECWDAEGFERLPDDVLRDIEAGIEALEV